MRYGREEGGVQPLLPDREPRGVTARADVPARAPERQQVLVGTVVTSGSGRTRARGCRRRGMCPPPARRPDAMGRPRGRRDPRRPSAGDAGDPTPTETTATPAGVAGVVDAGSAIGAQMRSETWERRAYVRLARGPSPSCGATGHSDATSGSRRPPDACCGRADQPSAQRDTLRRSARRRSQREAPPANNIDRWGRGRIASCHAPGKASGRTCPVAISAAETRCPTGYRRRSRRHVTGSPRAVVVFAIHCTIVS